MTIEKKARSVAEIVIDAGGSVTGRTRLQKIGYLLLAAGLEEEFSFVYKHYGPYSEELALSAKAAQIFGFLREDEFPASWGGTYFSYRSLLQKGVGQVHDQARTQLALLASRADAVELELAATAVFLRLEEGASDPWAETARRKPEKAENGRLEKAKALYSSLQAVETPQRLPAI